MGPAITSFKVETGGHSNRTAGIVLEEQGMVTHNTRKEQNPRNAIACAAVGAVQHRVNRTETAEGGTFVCAEIGGLVRLFLGKPAV